MTILLHRKQLGTNSVEKSGKATKKPNIGPYLSSQGLPNKYSQGLYLDLYMDAKGLSGFKSISQ